MSSVLSQLGSLGAIIAAVIGGMSMHLLYSRERHNTKADARAAREYDKAKTLTEVRERLKRTHQAFKRLSRINAPADEAELIEETIAAFMRLSEFRTAYKQQEMFFTSEEDSCAYHRLLQAYVRLNLALNLDAEHQKNPNYQAYLQRFRREMDQEYDAFKRRCTTLIEDALRNAA